MRRPRHLQPNTLEQRLRPGPSEGRLADTPFLLGQTVAMSQGKAWQTTGVEIAAAAGERGGDNRSAWIITLLHLKTLLVSCLQSHHTYTAAYYSRHSIQFFIILTGWQELRRNKANLQWHSQAKRPGVEGGSHLHAFGILIQFFYGGCRMR